MIIAIYNTGKYLNESITSVINQSIGYKEIQIILVNDGSTDNSEEICLKFKKLYILFILLSNIFSYFFFRKSETILNNYHINLN